MKSFRWLRSQTPKPEFGFGLGIANALSNLMCLTGCRWQGTSSQHHRENSDTFCRRPGISTGVLSDLLFHSYEDIPDGLHHSPSYTNLQYHWSVHRKETYFAVLV